MKKLTFEEIVSVACGVAYATEEADGVFLHRFTPAQEQAYKETSAEFYMKTSASAGIRLVFETDTENLQLGVSISPGSKSKGFILDVYANDAFVGSIATWPDGALEGNYQESYALGAGVKTVRIYLPWHACARIAELSVDDGAYIKPIRPSKKMLMFGDSITHGVTAVRQKNSYAVRLSEMLDADARNKGIGGDVFFPALAQCTDEVDFAPDYITVAYGTNDWGTNSKTPERFKEDVFAFYGALSKQYPNAKIFGITPIWRSDEERETLLSPFENLEKYIRESTKDFANVTVISGYDLVEHDPAFFFDDRLHPNDEGFAQYAENLYCEIKKHI